MTISILSLDDDDDDLDDEHDDWLSMYADNEHDFDDDNRWRH